MFNLCRFRGVFTYKINIKEKMSISYLLSYMNGVLAIKEAKLELIHFIKFDN